MKSDLVWEHDGDWTAARIYSGPKGWRIELDSRIQGETDGRVVFVPYGGEFERGLDMDGDYNDYTSNGSALIHWCESVKGARVLRKGMEVD
jgi:hypothetical protein